MDCPRIHFEEEGIDSYVKMAEKTANQVFDSNHPMIDLLREYDKFFRKNLWELQSITHGLHTILGMNAYMLFLSAVHVAASGAAASVFPLLRTSLESACYSLQMYRNPNLASVWARRHESEFHHKECRQKFSVKIASKLLEDEGQNNAADFTRRAYDSSIDYGAHPNVKGLVNHIGYDDKRDDGMVAVNLTGLYGPSHTETIRALCACLDMGLAIITVLALLETPLNAIMSDELQKLYSEKDLVTEKYFRTPKSIFLLIFNCIS